MASASRSKPRCLIWRKSLLNIAQFDALSEGDLIEAPSIMPVATDEPLVLHTQVSQPDRKEFIGTFFGITLGRWACIKQEDTLTWEKL